MTDPAQSRFVYVSYIRTTPERLWRALTTPEFQKMYWFGMHIDSDWQQGSAWQLINDEGDVRDRGVLTRVVPDKAIEMSWHHEWKPELTAEGEARCTIELEATEHEGVKLTIVHTMARSGSLLIEAVSGGWPRIVSGLKTMLETQAESART